jgi:hypothetical protein
MFSASRLYHPSEDSMATSEVEAQEVVTLNFPEGREYHWLGADSPMRQWQVGQCVTFRDYRWLVLTRSESANSLTFSLGAGSPAV